MSQVLQLCPLPQYKLFTIQGPDALKFLQGQVTCDIESLYLKQTDHTSKINCLPGAHCTHKGRIVFSFWAFLLEEDTVGLLVASDIKELAQAVLQKYIVFSKADIKNCEPDYQSYGLLGDSSLNDDLLVPENSYTGYISDNTVLLKTSLQQTLILSLENNLPKSFSELPQGANEDWAYHSLEQGFVDILSETSEQFTPHAAGFHHINEAISFSKGCYTGQEVVARMHYLGKHKREIFLLESHNDNLTINNGQPLYTTGKSQAIGEVIQAVFARKKWYALASIVVDIAEQGSVFLDKETIHPIKIIKTFAKTE